MSGDDLKNIKDLKEVMQVISETVPELLNKISKALYDAQEGEKLGQAVAAFYGSLVKSGMTNEQAYALTKEYMSSMSLGGMISNLVSQHRGHDDIEESIRRKIKREIERETDED